MSGLSRNYISKAPGIETKKRARDDYIDPFQQQAAAGQFRAKRVCAEDNERKENAVQFLRERYAAFRSGDKKEVFRTHHSRWSSFQQYQEDGGTAGFFAFQAAWKILGVHRAKHAMHDYHACTTCQAHEQRSALFELEANQLKEKKQETNDPVLREKLSLQILEAQANAAAIRVRGEVFCHSAFSNVSTQTHHMIFKSQRDVFQEMRENLQAGELFITGDFGVHQVQSSESGAGDLPDLVLVLHFLGKDGDLVHSYLDCETSGHFISQC